MYIMSRILIALLLLASSALAAASEHLVWRQLRPWTAGADGPAEREHARLWMDARNPRYLYLFGGLDYASPQNSRADFWRFDLAQERWHRGKLFGFPVPQAPGSLVTLPNSSILVYYGGERHEDAVADVYVGEVRGDTLRWTSVPAEPPGAARPNSMSSLVYDPLLRRFISVCGWTSDESCKPIGFALTRAHGSLQAVWQELQLSDDRLPQARYGFSYAYDSVHERIVVASGQLFTGPMINGIEQAEDTWFLDLRAGNRSHGVTWSQAQGRNLLRRRNPCWAHDTTRNHLYVWGGSQDGKTSVSGLYRLNLNLAEPDWELLKTEGNAPIRSSCTGVYDAHAHRLIFGFGNSGDGPTTDLWELSP